MKIRLLILKSVLIREKQGRWKMEDGSFRNKTKPRFLGSWGFLFVINVQKPWLTTSRSALTTLADVVNGVVDVKIYVTRRGKWGYERG